MLSLTLPIFVPALFAALLRAGLGDGWLEDAFVFTAGAIWLAAYAYGAIVLGYLIWMRRKTEHEIRRASYLAPPLMLVAFVAEISVVLLAMHPGRLEWQGFTAFAELGGCVVLLGYSYVFLTHGLLFLAKRLRLVAES